MQHPEIYIEDAIHCEQDGPFQSFEAAITALRRRAVIAWDSPPNQPPCILWRSCSREYYVLEYDAACETGRLLRSVHVLDISAKGSQWVEGFEQAWAANTV